MRLWRVNDDEVWVKCLVSGPSNASSRTVPHISSSELLQQREEIVEMFCLVASWFCCRRSDMTLIVVVALRKSSPMITVSMQIRVFGIIYENRWVVSLHQSRVCHLQLLRPDITTSSRPDYCCVRRRNITFHKCPRQREVLHKDHRKHPTLLFRNTTHPSETFTLSRKLTSNAPIFYMRLLYNLHKTTKQTLPALFLVCRELDRGDFGLKAGRR